MCIINYLVFFSLFFKISVLASTNATQGDYVLENPNLAEEIKVCKNHLKKVFPLILQTLTLEKSSLNEVKERLGPAHKKSQSSSKNQDVYYWNWDDTKNAIKMSFSNTLLKELSFRIPRGLSLGAELNKCTFTYKSQIIQSGDKVKYVLMIYRYEIVIDPRLEIIEEINLK